MRYFASGVKGPGERERERSFDNRNASEEVATLRAFALSEPERERLISLERSCSEIEPSGRGRLAEDFSSSGRKSSSRVQEKKGTRPREKRERTEGEKRHRKGTKARAKKDRERRLGDLLIGP